MTGPNEVNSNARATDNDETASAPAPVSGVVQGEIDDDEVPDAKEEAEVIARCDALGVEGIVQALIAGFRGFIADAEVTLETLSGVSVVSAAYRVKVNSLSDTMKMQDDSSVFLANVMKELAKKLEEPRKDMSDEARGALVEKNARIIMMLKEEVMLMVELELIGKELASHRKRLGLDDN